MSSPQFRRKITVWANYKRRARLWGYATHEVAPAWRVYFATLAYFWPQLETTRTLVQLEWSHYWLGWRHRNWRHLFVKIRSPLLCFCCCLLICLFAFLSFVFSKRVPHQKHLRVVFYSRACTRHIYIHIDIYAVKICAITLAFNINKLFDNMERLYFLCWKFFSVQVPFLFSWLLIPMLH